ncbi:MAG: tetratricopeptide repeat protein, partial [Planctomycetota bacterium]
MSAAEPGRIELGPPGPLGPEEQVEVSRFAQSLRLNTGFEFHVLVCDTRRVLEAALEAAGASVRCVRPPPGEGQPFANDLLRSLQTAIEDSKPGGSPIALDASASSLSAENEWRAVFRHLNERRNEIIQRLRVPLLLCVPPRLERALGHEAPDLWSIRGSGMRLTDRSPVSSERPVFKNPELFGQQPGDQDIERQRWVAMEACNSAPEVQAVQNSRLALMEFARGNHAEGIRLAQQTVDSYEKLAAANPVAFVRDLAASLHNLALMFSEVERTEDALFNAQEAARLYEELAKVQPGAFLPVFAGSLNNLANILSDLGRREEAL